MHSKTHTKASSLAWRRSSLARLPACLCVLALCSHMATAQQLHMAPFGRTPTGNTTLSVDTITGYLSPANFFERHLAKNRPLLMRRAMQKDAAFQKWQTDDYLNKSAALENPIINAENGKKENRSERMTQMHFQEFLRNYTTNQIYMVDDIPGFLLKDLILPWPLQCDCWMNAISDLMMWFSSGGTKSVVHTDAYENINCVVSGEKRFVLVDPHAHADKFQLREDGAFSASINVERVNVTAHPELAGVQFYEVRVTPGDCLYLPIGWIHQVNSPAEIGRNLAINYWFNVRRAFPLLTHVARIRLTEKSRRRQQQEKQPHSTSIPNGLQQEQQLQTEQLNNKNQSESWNALFNSFSSFSGNENETRSFCQCDAEFDETLDLTKVVSKSFRKKRAYSNLLDKFKEEFSKFLRNISIQLLTFESFCELHLLDFVGIQMEERLRASLTNYLAQIFKIFDKNSDQKIELRDVESINFRDFSRIQSYFQMFWKHSHAAISGIISNNNGGVEERSRSKTEL